MASVHSLTDEDLREILLRLPSLSTLVRAACTCRRWYTVVASWRDFGDRFRRLRPPLLLGLFFNPRSSCGPAIPSFAPCRRDDPDAVAAVLAGDFHLTQLQVAVASRAPPDWTVEDTRCGRLLLLNWTAHLLTLINPMARRCEGLFDLCEDNVPFYDGYGANSHFASAHLVCDEEEPTRFHICCLVYDDYRVRIVVFTSEFLERFTLPWLEVPEPGGIDNRKWLRGGMQAGRFIYWPYRDCTRVVIMDTGLQPPSPSSLSVQEIPPSLRPPPQNPPVEDEFRKFVLGDTKSGEFCAVYIVDGYNAHVMLGGHRHDFSGPWVTSRVFDVHAVLPTLLPKLALHTISDGILYFTTSKKYYDTKTPCWFARLCLETGRVEKLFKGAYFVCCKPYHLWPSWVPTISATTPEKGGAPLGST